MPDGAAVAFDDAATPFDGAAVPFDGAAVVPPPYGLAPLGAAGPARPRRERRRERRADRRRDEALAVALYLLADED